MVALPFLVIVRDTLGGGGNDNADNDNNVNGEYEYDYDEYEYDKYECGDDDNDNEVPKIKGNGSISKISILFSLSEFTTVISLYISLSPSLLFHLSSHLLLVGASHNPCCDGSRLCKLPLTLSQNSLSHSISLPPFTLH